MFSLLFVVVAIVVVIGVLYGRSRFASGDSARVETAGSALSPQLGSGLARWVGAGLITDDEARAIQAFEQAQAAARPRPRVSPVVESLAYVGGVLLAVGAGMLVAQFWTRLGTGGHLGVLGVAAVVTGVVGMVVGESDSVTWRLRGFLWALSVAAIAATAGLVAYEVVGARGEPVALATAGIGAVAAGAYWQLKSRPLQHLLAFVGIAVSIGVGIFWAGGSGTDALIGLALWLLGAAWAWLAWQRRIPPEFVGFLLGVIATLVACGIVAGRLEWLAPLAGLVTAGLWVGVGVARNEPFAMAPGVLGVFVFLPWTMGYYFGESLGAPAIAMLSGVVLLGVVLLLVRRGRGGRRPGSRSRFHAGARHRTSAPTPTPVRS